MQQQQQQSEIAAPTAMGDHTDIVWINHQHGLLIRPARASDTDGRFDLVLHDGALWAIVGTTRLLV